MQSEQQQEDGTLSGEQDALLYDHYANIIYAYVRLYTASREDAEDLTVEVFLAALERNNLSGLSDKEQLAWLRRVARNKLADIYRKSNRHPSIEPGELAESVDEDERSSPEYVALHQEEYRQLQSAMSNLTELQRQVLQLHFGNDLRLREIAILLDKREEAVRKLLERALARLRSVYHQNKGEENYGLSR
jgi:RNA polymerase sigma factor (sigma-70 family)